MNQLHFRLRDVVAAVVVCGLAAVAVVPAVATSREAARRRQCADHLRAIGTALRQYHDVHGSLPPAAVWAPGTLSTIMLFNVQRIDRITYENWAQSLLPYLGRADIADLFNRRHLLMGQANADARTTRIAEFTCPTDHFNSDQNRYEFRPSADAPASAEFARGNYAINGGTHSIKYLPDSTTQPRGESMRITLDHERRLFRAMGTGVAGINQCLTFADLVNGQSTLAAIDEIRAGVHPLDLRGTWALGQIGASITWAHGVVGDDCGPNNQWERSDDIRDCGLLHKVVGGDRLREWRMPCASYVEQNQEATARSQHPGGVHVLFLDGAARFVRDEVDRGLWHVMHSRETPAAILEDLLFSSLDAPEPPHNAPTPSIRAIDPEPGETLRNSWEMRFIAIPAGVFTMGIPDVGNDAPAPPECAPHEVTISHAFWMGKYEVTQRQYQSVMGKKPSQHSPDTAGLESTDDFPVENIDWYEADEFCRRLGEAPEEKAAGRRYRLPTEAEWEYACRSGKSEPYRWVANRRPDDQSGEAAGISPPLPLAKVGSYPPNAFGLYDMRGNVWEWCVDWFDRSYYSRSPRVDPQGPANGYLKVLRGSDWIFISEPCHINYSIMSPWRKSPFVGFRVVCEFGGDGP